MQIVHRISLESSAKIRRELASLDIVVAGEGLITFEIDEGRARWPELERWLAAQRPLDIVSTRFTAKEVEQAVWLSLSATGHHGYPQPEDDYKILTYDDAQYCQACGTGLKQKAPFRLRGEPKWSRTSVLQLNWVFDEFFVTPELWKAVFEPNGVGCRPVQNTKGVELTTVVQLDVREEVNAATEGLKLAVCSACKCQKYLPVTRGYFPPLVATPRADIAKTRQYFGSGSSAFRVVLVSQKLGKVLRERKIRGIEFVPIAGAPPSS